MRSLAEAWGWYRKTRGLVGLTRRLAAKYWADLPWEAIGNDDRFLGVGAEDVVGDVDEFLGEFDDVAVLLLFSVFERLVRDRVTQEIEVEALSIRHPALRGAARTLKEGLEEKSFSHHVLEPYRHLDPDLVEQVNQVRQYRNWVAHGKKADRKVNLVTPQVAFDRSSAFLVRIGVEPS